MKTQTHAYKAGDKNCLGYLSWDETLSGPRPGVLVFPEAFGLNDHARERADRLAKLGYVALAVDMYGDGAVFKDMSQLGAAIQPLNADRQLWRSRTRAAFDTLVALPQVDRNRIAAIGHCMGGTSCLELARSNPDIAAIATFHAGLNLGLPEDAGKIRAKVLINNGAEDPLVKKEAIDALVAELQRDKVDWQFINYGNTVHSFTNPDADARGAPGFAYSATSEARSWAAMRHLFAEVFGSDIR
jgi:dienelactone hydrolase